MALTRVRIPNANARVQTSRRYSLAVKGNRVDLTEMAGQRAQASALRNTPDLRSSVIAPRNNNVAMDRKAPNTSLVTYKNTPTSPRHQIPDSQRRVSRSGDCSVGVRHL